MGHKLAMGFSVFFLIVGLAATAPAAGTGTSSTWPSKAGTKAKAASLYDQGVEAHKNNNFQKALSLFAQALSEDRNNPDILNMLSHTQLKLGKIDEAIENYKKALKLKPRFPQAREYIGEAYIQAALREIKILEGYGAEAKEDLEDLKERIQEGRGEIIVAAKA